MNKNDLIIETLDGQALDLGKDFSITLDLVSTPFDSEVLRGSSSLPVTFPATPANKRKLKFPHNPASKNALFVTEVRLKVGGFSLLCKMRVKDAGNEKFTASILAGVGIVADDLKGTKLSDLDILHHFSEIDLRPFMVFQVDFPDGLPANGSIVKVPLVRYNNAASAVASTVYYAVPFQNSREQLVLDLIAKINAAGTHPQAYSSTRHYAQFEVVFDPTTNIYYEASQASHGRPLVPPTFLMGNVYSADSYVYDDLGDCYRCIQTHQNQALSNAAYWEFVLDYPFWFSFWAEQWRDVWEQGHAYRWWWYTDPADNYSVEAVPVIYGPTAARRIKLIDKTAGNPYPMDYLRSFYVNTSNNFSIVQQAVFPGPDEIYTLLMHLMKNRAKFYPEIKYAFPPIYNPAAYKEDIPEYYYFNYFRATSDDLQDDELAYYRNIYTVSQYLNSPQLFLFFIFEKIAEKLGYTLDYSAFNQPHYAEYLQILVYNNNSFEGFINAYFEKHQHGTPYNVINLKPHVPDMTVSEFLNSVRNYLGLHIDFSLFTKTMTVQPLRELVVNISQQEQDWTGICEPNAVVNEIEEEGAVLSFEGDSSDKLWDERVKPLEDMTVNPPVQSFNDLPATPQNLTEVRLVLDENVYYKAAYDEDGEFYFWEFYSEPYHSITVGNGAASITTNCAPMLMYKGFDETLNGSRYWLVPQISQPASLTGLGKPRQPFGLRLMFWRGMQREANLNDGSYTQGFLYPMASSDTVDFFGNVIAQKSLRFEGPAGLYENMWKHFLAFRDSSKPVKYQARLESYHLSKLSFGSAIRVDNARYLIKRVRVTFPIRKTAEVELYKL